MSVNRVILVGRLGKDVELRSSQSGTQIGKFSLATDTGFGDKRKTDWHNIVTFGRVAENCARYLKKGSQVYIEGRISYEKWEKEPGNVINFTNIIANDVQFLDTRSSSSNYDAGGPPSTYSAPASAPSNAPDNFASPPSFDDGFSDEDIPF